jgi:hypothetical protein
MQEAAAAAKLVMTEAKFSLSTSFGTMFSKARTTTNPEIMFSARYLPPSFYSPQDWLFSYTNSVNVLKYLVDDFECTDGKPITTSPLYNSATPYANRDPRLKVHHYCARRFKGHCTLIPLLIRPPRRSQWFFTA